VNAFWKRRLRREPDEGNLHVRFDEGEGSVVIGIAFHPMLSSLLYWLKSVWSFAGTIYAGWERGDREGEGGEKRKAGQTGPAFSHTHLRTSA